MPCGGIKIKNLTPLISGGDSRIPAILIKLLIAEMAGYMDKSFPGSGCASEFLCSEAFPPKNGLRKFRVDGDCIDCRSGM